MGYFGVQRRILWATVAHNFGLPCLDSELLWGTVAWNLELRCLNHGPVCCTVVYCCGKLHKFSQVVPTMINTAIQRCLLEDLDSWASRCERQRLKERTPRQRPFVWTSWTSSIMYLKRFGLIPPLSCTLLRPLIKIVFLMVPYGYIIIRLKKNS